MNKEIIDLDLDAYNYAKKILAVDCKDEAMIYVRSRKSDDESSIFIAVSGDKDYAYTGVRELMKSSKGFFEVCIDAVLDHAEEFDIDLEEYMEDGD